MQLVYGIIIITIIVINNTPESSKFPIIILLVFDTKRGFIVIALVHQLDISAYQHITSIYYQYYVLVKPFVLSVVVVVVVGAIEFIMFCVYYIFVGFDAFRFHGLREFYALSTKLIYSMYIFDVNNISFD